MSKSNGSSSWAHKEVFSTGEAAEICRVSAQTIIRCFDKGRINGFRVPGSRFRRIPRSELLRFMRNNDIPTDALESPARRVLVVDDDQQFVEFVRDLLRSDDRFEIKTATTAYDAGIMTEQFKPHIVLLDLVLPDVNGDVVCQRIKARPDLSDTKVLIVSGAVGPDQAEHLARIGADGVLRKPFDVQNLVHHMEHLLRLLPGSTGTS